MEHQERSCIDCAVRNCDKMDKISGFLPDNTDEPGST